MIIATLNVLAGRLGEASNSPSEPILQTGSDQLWALV